MIRVGYYNLDGKLTCWRECKTRNEALFFVGLNNSGFKNIVARIIEEESTTQNTNA